MTSIAILVTGAPYSSSSSRTALEFARQVVASGHRIELLFFYHEAVTAGSTLGVTAQDEHHLPSAWQSFIRESNTEAVICIASGLKRGIINAAEAHRFSRPAHNLDGLIRLGGLGEWITAVRNADKQIVFGA